MGVQSMSGSINQLQAECTWHPRYPLRVKWSLLVLLVAIPRLALAEPKVAVAPLDDDDGKIAEMVGDAVSERAKLTKPARVEGAMRSMGMSKLSSKSLKKLRAKLDVDVVIFGSVERDGSTKRVSLTFAGTGKTKPKLELEASTPKEFRKELAGKVAKRIAAAMEGEGGDDEEDEEDTKEAERKAREEERKKKEEEEERKAREEERKKKEEEEERKREEETRRKKRDDDERRTKRDDDEERGDRKRRRDDDEERGDRKRRDDDEERGDRKRRDDDEERGDRKRRDEDEDDRRGKKRDKRVAADEDEEDSGRARKRLGDEDEDESDEERPRRKRKKQRRHALTQTALWLDGGGAFARRTLTWNATGMVQPPPVGTVAPAVQIEGELYPAAFSSVKPTVAGFGVAAGYTRSFALGIAVPGTQIVAPILSGHFTLGARYRFVFGQHSLAIGASYWKRYYMADRSKLMTKDQLDMPDVDYSAVAPGIVARIAATPKIAAFGTLDVPLVLYSGPIQLPASYGSAKIIAFDFHGGAQIIVADHIALEITAELTNIGFAFTKQAGSKASTREVTSATDRSIGLSATVGYAY